MVMEEQENSSGLASESIPVPRVHDTIAETEEAAVNQEENERRRKPRHRKKALHALIRKQMEFYFSDANLSKDRFLANLLKDDPYVDLNVFLQFNKIRALTNETHRIAKALEASEMLAISDDGTKVRRITPIKIREDCDACTIYVQGLPPDADHDWLISIFSQFGPVAYVSIPKYKTNKKIKGFAFVEFETEEGAKKCLEAFEAKACVLPSYTAPETLLSITTFSEDDPPSGLDHENLGSEPMVQDVKIPEKPAPPPTLTETESESDSGVSKSEKTKSQDAKAEKRAASPKNSSEPKSNPVKAKKAKINGNDSGNVSIDDESKEEVSESTDAGEKMDESEADENKANENAKKDGEEKEGEKKKKKRKRKNRAGYELVDITEYRLRIMSKKEWKKVRNKYLQLQRDKMKQLKQHLKKTRFNQWNTHDRREKMDTDDGVKKEKEEKKEARAYTFAEGLIIKIELDEPCANSKSIKNELRNEPGVQYIDVKDGSPCAFIRCDTAEAAENFVKKYCEEKNVSILQDEEEKAYWEKIKQDREMKFSKKDRSKQRGRDKLLKKAEKELGKHIKFDEVDV